MIACDPAAFSRSSEYAPHRAVRAEYREAISSGRTSPAHVVPRPRIRSTRADLGGRSVKSNVPLSTVPLRLDRAPRSLSFRSRVGAVVAFVVVLVGGYGVANAASKREAPQRSYVVQPGDTLWTIARAQQPRGDIRPLVEQLSRDNHGSNLQIGQTISITL